MIMRSTRSKQRKPPVVPAFRDARGRGGGPGTRHRERLVGATVADALVRHRLAREEGSSEALADTRRGGASRTMRAEKIFKLAKGFRGRAKNTIRAARNRVEKALQYAYRDRKAKKREFRELWIQQINAATREHGVKYSEFMHGLKEENVVVDRKILAELAQTEPYSFKALVDQVKRMKGIE